jgi:hypothetical protein
MFLVERFNGRRTSYDKPPTAISRPRQPRGPRRACAVGWERRGRSDMGSICR